MRKAILGLGLFGVVAVMPTSASADCCHEVRIYTISGDTTHTWASGTVSGEQSPANIGCTVGSSTGEYGFTFASCWAENSDGKYLSCVTLEPGLITAAQAVNSASYIVFGVTNKTGECSSLHVQNGSQFLP